jgi:hypothetical protein
MDDLLCRDMSSESQIPRSSAQAVTLVLNPNARRLKLDAVDVDHFKQLLPPDSEVHLTRSLDELDELMSNWAHGERTLCFFGGDGSISRGITSLIRHHGEDFELPPVLPVRAGTINMLCNHTGKRESAERTLEHWGGQTGIAPSTHRIREIPTLKIEIEGHEAEGPRYGFVFAWGVGHRALREYYERNASPNAIDAAVVATQAFLQAITPFNEELPLFKKERLQLRVNDGDPITEPMRALTAGTISRMTLGLRPLPGGDIKPGGFHFSANGMPLFKVAAYVPALIFGFGDQSELDFGPQLVCGKNVQSVECILTDGFTLDGEMIELDKPSRVRLSAGPVARFWTRNLS